MQTVLCALGIYFHACANTSLFQGAVVCQGSEYMMQLSGQCLLLINLWNLALNRNDQWSSKNNWLMLLLLSSDIQDSVGMSQSFIYDYYFLSIHSLVGSTSSSTSHVCWSKKCSFPDCCPIGNRSLSPAWDHTEEWDITSPPLSSQLQHSQ